MAARKKATKKKASRKKTVREKSAKQQSAVRARAPGPRTVRSSSLLHGARCFASVATSEDARSQFAIPAEISNEGSRLGRAYHELQALAQKQGYDAARESIAKIAAQHGANAQELGWLFSRLRIDSTSEFFDAVHIEEPLEYEVAPGLKLTGTPDLVRLYNQGKSLDVIDWKSGRLAISEDPDAYSHDQVISYAVMALMSYTGTYDGRAIVYPVRLGDKPSIFHLDAKVAVEETQRIRRLVSDIDRQRDLEPVDREYGVGEHCRWCDGRRICPAYRKDMEAALAIVPAAPDGGKGLRGRLKERAAELEAAVGKLIAQSPTKAMEYKKLARDLADSIDAALKHDVEFWGAIDTKDGKELAFSPYKTSVTLNVPLVRQVLLNALQTHTTLSEGVAGYICDAVEKGLEDRPMVERQRLVHRKKEE